jgi:hypothetical protein
MLVSFGQYGLCCALLASSPFSHRPFPSKPSKDTVNNLCRDKKQTEYNTRSLWFYEPVNHLLYIEAKPRALHIQHCWASKVLFGRIRWKSDSVMFEMENYINF